MNRLVAIALSLLLAGAAGLSFAQDAPPAGSAPGAQPPVKAGKHPRIREIRGRLMEQMKRIRQGVRSKELTRDQARDLRSKVLAVRGQMKADIRQNGKRELTQEQFQQLNQRLDENSKAIYGEKHGGLEPPATGAPPADPGAPAAP